jgi:dedicator of cytokinesis protein 3
VASPTPDDHQANGNRVASPTPDGRPARQDKKRLSLAFLTKGVITGESQSDKENKRDEITALPQRADDAESTTASSHSRSRSKDTNRTRLSLSFLRPTSPLEALPDFASNENVSSMSRAASQKSRPDTSKSEKSSDGTTRRGSVKKRLSFMSISKKSSKNSVAGRGRRDDVLVEE